MERNTSRSCEIYQTFGDCKFGKSCSRPHDCLPYNTKKVRARIISDNTAGLVRFTVTENDADAVTTLYIGSSDWFRNGSVAGDVVDLQVSEKHHNPSLCQFARILCIHESSRDSSDRKNTENSLCFAFSTFNDCRFGEKCKHIHQCTADQRIEFGKIVSVMHCQEGSKIILNTLSEKRACLVPNESWYMQGATEGDFVIFQESSRQHDSGDKSAPIYFGRVLEVLQSPVSVNTMHDIPLERGLKHGFTFDPPGTKTRIGACSIEKCMEKNAHGKDCQRIGEHILAISLTEKCFKKLGKYFEPIYRHRGPYASFSPETIQPAISVYAHSESGCVEGPLLSYVTVDPGNAFTYGEPGKFRELLDQLWSQFANQQFIKVSAQNWLSTLILDYPDSWKERFVTNLMTSYFNKQVTKFMKSKRGFVMFAQNHDSEVKIAQEELLIPLKFINDVVNAWKLNKKEKEFQLAALFGSSNQAANVFMEETYLPDMYRTDAISSEDIPEDKIVKFTAPGKRTQDFMNQQVLMNCMFGLSEPMYSKEDAFGILADRYDTPTVFKSVVRDLYNTSVQLQIVGFGERWRRSYQEVQLKHLLHQLRDEKNCAILPSLEDALEDLNKPDDVVKSFFPVESISVTLKDMKTNEYCNTKLTKVSGETINILRTKVMEEGIESEAVKDVLSKLISCKTEDIAPYEPLENGTIMTLKRGVELQLQMSQNNEVFHHNLRLLRIGRNCHLCLTHLNSPKRAFMCSREDVGEFVTKDILDDIKKQIAENTLTTSTLQEVKIQWKNDYFYGGTFQTSCEISVGCFLCIRNEICKDEGEISFVWTCHGVVSKIARDLVHFLVCSLGQDETCETSKARSASDGYVVEVINVK